MSRGAIVTAQSGPPRAARPRPGRARGVEEHRDLILGGPHRVERAGIEEVREAGSVQLHHGQGRVDRPLPFGIGEDEAGAGVLEDVVDRVAWQLEAHRHRDHARAHGADRPPGIPRDWRRGWRCGRRGDDRAPPGRVPPPGRPIDRTMGPLARRRRLGKIDEGDLLGVGGPVEQVAEIVECPHAQGRHCGGGGVAVDGERGGNRRPARRGHVGSEALGERPGLRALLALAVGRLLGARVDAVLVHRGHASALDDDAAVDEHRVHAAPVSA